MDLDLSIDEVLVTLGSLKYLENRYERGAVPLEYLKKSNQDLEKAVDNALENVRGVIKKLESSLGNGHGGYIFLYTPNGIRDEGLFKALRGEIPQNSDPQKSTVFWSTKYNNFVIQERFAEDIEKAIQEYYEGKVKLVKDPSWSSKPNTWQIVRKREGGT